MRISRKNNVSSTQSSEISERNMIEPTNRLRSRTRTLLPNIRESLVNSRNSKENSSILRKPISRGTTKSKQWTKKRYKSLNKKLSSATLSSMVSNWESTGQGPIKPKTKNRSKKKSKTFLEIRRRKKSNKLCAFQRKSFHSCWTYWYRKPTLSSTIKWGKNWREHLSKKSSSKRWSCWRRHCLLTLFNNSTCLSIWWLMIANTSVRRRNIRFLSKNSEKNSRPDNKRKERWKRKTEECKRKRKSKNKKLNPLQSFRNKSEESILDQTSKLIQFWLWTFWYNGWIRDRRGRRCYRRPSRNRSSSFHRDKRRSTSPERERSIGSTWRKYSHNGHSGSGKFLTSHSLNTTTCF